jgi:hypothetical protein
VSDQPAKPIRLSGHARGYIERRGFSEDEVVEAIREGVWQPARANRLETSKDFAYHALWNGVLYATKKVRPVFVDDPGEIVVVTVYTYFF